MNDMNIPSNNMPTRMISRPIRLIAFFGLLLAIVFHLHATLVAPPDAVTPDGGRYHGPLVDGLIHGHGRMEWNNGMRYEGEFQKGLFAGQGKLQWRSGDVYEGHFENGMMSGQGRFENKQGDVYEGRFENDEFTGVGVYTRKEGGQFKGEFVKWSPHGKGAFTDTEGNVYEGRFDNGDLSDAGQLTYKDGGSYKGEFQSWRFHGQGELKLANGDTYKGKFAQGLYNGEGTLTYAKPQKDGRTEDKGVWNYGALENKADESKTAANVEAALYNQRVLLDKALAGLSPHDPRKINLFLLAVAGDGSQEVFRREVDFVRQQFERDFGARGHILTLINSRNTVESAPMATITSIRESLKGVAARMDKEKDILFLFLTSHGSKNHELTLGQNGMDLRDLPAKELGDALKETGIRWKVIVISACYAGGFIDSVKDDRTLVIAAARHDRRSFGCSDDNDFTYFGRAFFKESLSPAISFQQAFQKAEKLVKEWEVKDLKEDGESKKDDYHSLPQMHNPQAIQAYLHRWEAQLAAERARIQMAATH